MYIGILGILEKFQIVIFGRNTITDKQVWYSNKTSTMLMRSCGGTCIQSMEEGLLLKNYNLQSQQTQLSLDNSFSKIEVIRFIIL